MCVWGGGGGEPVLVGGVVSGEVLWVGCYSAS